MIVPFKRDDAEQKCHGEAPEAPAGDGLAQGEAGQGSGEKIGHAHMLVRRGIADEDRNRYARYHEDDEGEADIGLAPAIGADEISDDRRHDRGAEPDARERHAEREAAPAVEPFRHDIGVGNGRLADAAEAAQHEEEIDDEERARHLRLHRDRERVERNADQEHAARAPAVDRGAEERARGRGDEVLHQERPGERGAADMERLRHRPQEHAEAEDIDDPGAAHEAEDRGRDDPPAIAEDPAHARFHPIQSHSAWPMTRSLSEADRNGSSSVNIVTHCRYETGMRVRSVPQKKRLGPNAS